ncbi:hypothetical protein LY78DRAFT_35525 [Colletotrichum sublineola]|nr:hypothetical protein LY78DRAFT_35525 [Colletotrichum sublineola]
MDTTGLSVPGSMEGDSGISEDTFTVTLPSAASKRLYWTLNGPLESSIQVAPSHYYEPGDVMEPYFRPGDTDSGPAPSWHPVSQESLMDPPVTAITVRVQCIDSWEELWVDLYRDQIDTRTDPRRPRAQDVQLEVKTSGAFLTVHEYVSIVHPWLMGLRERILDAQGRAELHPPWPPETKLAVLWIDLGPLNVDKEDMDSWAYSRRKPGPPVQLTPEQREEAHRKVIERMKERSAARIRELERLRREGNNQPFIIDSRTGRVVIRSEVGRKAGA